MSYVERVIDLQFDLGVGQTFADGSNSAVFTGLRISATISKAGSFGLNELNMRVNGLTSDVANTLTTLGKFLTSAKLNTVTVLAGDANSTSRATAFVGIIVQAWQDFAGAPDVAVVLTAQTGALLALQPAAPNSFSGPTDVAVIMAQLAAQGGLAFENNGVSGILIRNPYLSLTLRDQISIAAAQADIGFLIDDVNGVQTLAIWPNGGNRIHTVPVISGGGILPGGTELPNTGMVGYPAWTDKGIMVKMLYNPQIIYNALIEVMSVITVANGQWQVFAVTHELESQVFGGKWFTTVQCSVLGHSVIADE